MASHEILSRCVTLGREFGRLEMRDHAKLLREFYVAARDRKPCTNTWSADFVDHWLGLLRLPPFENMFEVRVPPYNCLTCSPAGATPSRRTVNTFPGGVLMNCSQCHRQWLELDR